MEKAFSGGLEFDEPPFKVTASNITPDKETGIGGWTDAQIKTALRKGVRPNGTPLAMIMPSDFYEIMTERDLNAVVAYLRSLKPIKNKVPDPIYKMQQMHHPFAGGEKPYTEAMMSDKLKKGFYLATIAHCMECHTPMGPRGREFATKLAPAASNFPGPWGKSVSRNITSSKTKGIGAWSDAEIKRAITTASARTAASSSRNGLPFLRQDDRRRPRRRRGLSAHGAGEGVTAPVMPRESGASSTPSGYWIARFRGQ